MDLKFHFSWIVVQRKPLFAPVNDFFGFVHDTFLRCSELVGRSSSLIWLAPDHVHVYAESDSEESPETLPKRMKEFLGEKILEEFPDLKRRINSRAGPWGEHLLWRRWVNRPGL